MQSGNTFMQLVLPNAAEGRTLARRTRSASQQERKREETLSRERGKNENSVKRCQAR